ncbi:toxic anion resistance protein [Peptostreptococcus porci]|uniref:Toxic anion resistance protein n=1 Tax=Peptostreptococcus porci TaxID=2652282 RepID=A0A6N7X1Z6_9FIRM|nr:toxic anion resistance protein [Peptostreptococcus porci]MDD7182959.1 toxic anion resistance protein [Peptostreptococcus porci]MDY5437360.1 toxic anion resistance protein [Peptostreptococcus porci]MDY5480427.1 toxic anion resistance protein [Peptostreptococcus porci]MST63018.1 toxic anion resistance protein [Peptostreptococcus porci]
MSEEIKLTFDGLVEQEIKNENSSELNIKSLADFDQFDMSNFTEEEKQMVQDFSEKIDISNSQLVLEYGAGVQKKMSDFSDQTLSVIRTKDLGEVGDMISNLVVELKNFDLDSDKKDSGIFSFFKKAAKKKDMIQARYTEAETNVDEIVKTLEKQQITLMKDVAMLDQMYDLNKNYFKEVSMYIVAGKKKLEEVNTKTLPELNAIVTANRRDEDIQKLDELNSQVVRFEKKLHDLDLSRAISLQTAPQIRMVQNVNMEMVEKIQSTIVNTIPLWKNQMVLSLGVANAQEAVKIQKQISDTTNALLNKNAETLKMATIEAAKESERGIVDIETLKKTNEALISSLDEVMKIQEDGRTKRAEAEKEIRNLENELKSKIIEIATK